MNTKAVITSQYLATLNMLKQAIDKCPAALWNSPQDKNKFWHLAYHALFYTHLYLQSTEKEFVPWPKHRDEYEFMGPLPWPPHKKPNIGDPYQKEEVLEFLEFCRQQVAERVDALNLDGASGFEWLPFGKLELQFYNIRHLQQHTGELCERLGQANIDVDWVGLAHN
jgi:hypothetical protein